MEQKKSNQILLNIRTIWMTMAKQGFVSNRSEKALKYFLYKNVIKSKNIKNISMLNNEVANIALNEIKNFHYHHIINALHEHNISIPQADNNNPIGYYPLVSFYEKLQQNEI